MTEDARLMDLLEEWERLFEQGRDAPAKELCRDCPELEREFEELIFRYKQMAWLDLPPGVGDENPRIEKRKKAGKPSRFGGLLLRPGEGVIPGHSLIRGLGEGSFGEVWSAKTHEGRLVAVKFLRSALSVSDDTPLVEVELSGLSRIWRLSHPHLLKIYYSQQVAGVGGMVEDDGNEKGAGILCGNNGPHPSRPPSAQVVANTVFVVMELADDTLANHFQALRGEGWPLLHRCAYALLLLRGAAEALDHLREKHQIMHLDIKPTNLLLVSGQCKVSDFGTVSKIRPGQLDHGSVIICNPPDSGAERASEYYGSCWEVPHEEALARGSALLTISGGFTAKYAPPEACLYRKFNRSFDGYSLALTFCELVTGALPFGGGCDESPRRTSGEMDIRDIPKPLQPLIRKQLSPDSGNRFSSCVEFVSAMRDALWPEVRGDSKAEAWLKGWDFPTGEPAAGDEEAATPGRPATLPSAASNGPGKALEPRTDTAATQSGVRSRNGIFLVRTLKRAGALIWAVVLALLMIVGKRSAALFHILFRRAEGRRRGGADGPTLLLLAALAFAVCWAPYVVAGGVIDLIGLLNPLRRERRGENESAVSGLPLLWLAAFATSFAISLVVWKCVSRLQPLHGEATWPPSGSQERSDHPSDPPKRQGEPRPRAVDRQKQDDGLKESLDDEPPR